MVLDTMIIHSEAPHVHNRREWKERWRVWYCGEPKKKGYGIKLSIAVSMEARPRVLWASVAPASLGDAAMEMRDGGLFQFLRRGERVLTDGSTEYQGSLWCRAPPHRNMLAYVRELDGMELTLHRGVERFNRWVRSWGVCSGRFRMAPSEPGFYRKIASCAISCVRLISLDQRLQRSEYY